MVVVERESREGGVNPFAAEAAMNQEGERGRAVGWESR